MWKPKNNGIAIPLRRIKWGWIAYSNSSGGGWAANFQSSHQTPTEEETTIFPTWGNIYRNE